MTQTAQIDAPLIPAHLQIRPPVHLSHELIVTPHQRAVVMATETAKRYGLTLKQLMARTHCRENAWARQEVYYRLATEFAWSFPKMGRFFRRHHTTCLYGLRKYAQRHNLPLPKPNRLQTMRKVAA